MKGKQIRSAHRPEPLNHFPSDDYWTIGHEPMGSWVRAFPGDGLQPTRLHFAGVRAFTRFLLARKTAGEYYDQASTKKYNLMDEALKFSWPHMENELTKLLRVSGLEFIIDARAQQEIKNKQRRASARYSRWLPKNEDESGNIEWEFDPGTIEKGHLEESTRLLKQQGWESLLFPYAFQGVCEMATKENVLLTMFMGSGKTRAAIALSEYWRELDSLPNPTIILALKRHFGAWEEELAKLPVITGAYQGEVYESWFKKDDEPEFNRPFLFISLEKLVRLEKYEFERLQEVIKGSTVILDESYTISNRTADRTKSVMRLRGAHHIACSGTPIRSFVMQLLPVLQWTFYGGSIALPDYPADRSFGHILFEKRFVGYAIASDGQLKKVPYINNVSALQELLAPLMYRRLRNEPEVVAALGEVKIELEYIDVQLDTKHQNLYESVLVQFIDWYQRELKSRGINSLVYSEILPKLSYLLMAIVSPWKLADHNDGEFSWPVAPRDTTAITYATLEIIQKEELEGHTCVVFGHTVDALQLIYEKLREAKVASIFLHGGIDVDRRKRYIQAFQRGEFSVLVGTYGVLSESLNLNVADRAILTEATWVPSVIAQAIGRITRGIQENTPRAYFIRVPGTLQEYQLNWCALKQYSINAALEKTEQKVNDEHILDIQVYLNLLVNNISEAKALGRQYKISTSDIWTTRSDEVDSTRLSPDL